MCGIFAYRGNKPAVRILEHGLQRLEYRGYDSAGVALMQETWSVQLLRAVGKVSALSATIHDQFPEYAGLGEYTMGIAHTRWATHGGVTENNTHPHHDAKRDFWVVHNGIIENQYKLKTQLADEWYEFYGQTDTEVVPALLAKYRTGNLRETVEQVLPLLHGAYAFVIMSAHTPNEMIAVKWGSPMIFGRDFAHNDMFFSSDAQALVNYADEIIHLQDGDVVHIVGDTYTIRNEWASIQKSFAILDTESLEASKGDYEHFMLKEIYEQPVVLERILKGRVDLTTGSITAEALQKMDVPVLQEIVLVWCGTSYNAARMGAVWLQEFSGIRAHAEIASEYIYDPIRTWPEVLHVFLSQSGETADSIQVLNYIKERGGKTFGIVNVVGSSIAHLTDGGLFMRAGAEIGVASTKAYMAQMMCLLIMSLYIGKKRGMPLTKYNDILRNLPLMPELLRDMLADTGHIRSIANDVAQYTDMFFLWRHYQLPIAHEWSLKMKEISYIHSESYPAGELKHWPLALISPATPSIILMPQDELFLHTMSSLQEVKARNGKVLVVSDVDVAEADWQIQIPSTIPVMSVFCTTLATQILSYYTALSLGREIDKPRNLAKSVTVK